MMKKTMAAMLLAMMQSAFAIQLMDGKYINFEDFVREQGYHVVDQNGQVNVGSCRTVDNYKTNCVSEINAPLFYQCDDGRCFYHSAKYERNWSLFASGSVEF